uniref:Ig-like domain-containing protein n=1 Tax=Monodelphis domestica TaxID=13616 RepID=A0A5F8H588_MONDO
LACPILISVLLFSGVTSQVVVTQGPSLTVIQERTITLTCSSSAGALITGLCPYWFHQKSGHETILQSSTNNPSSGVPACFFGSLLGNKGALTIPEVQSEDEAGYDCSIWHNSSCHCEKRILYGVNTVREFASHLLK